MTENATPIYQCLKCGMVTLYPSFSVYTEYLDEKNCDIFCTRCLGDIVELDSNYEPTDFTDYLGEQTVNTLHT